MWRKVSIVNSTSSIRTNHKFRDQNARPLATIERQQIMPPHSWTARKL